MAEANSGMGSRRNRFWFWMIGLVCLTPVVLSYLTYYVWRPEGRTNYGELLQPPYDAAKITLAPADSGTIGSLEAVRGKWVYLVMGESSCEQACQDRLWKTRQLRTATGGERERVERVWVMTDPGQPAQTLLAEHQGLKLARGSLDDLSRSLPAEQGTALSAHIFIIDPLGNIILRYGKDADPNKMKRDITKLLKASRIG